MDLCCLQQWTCSKKLSQAKINQFYDSKLHKFSPHWTFQSNQKIAVGFEPKEKFDSNSDLEADFSLASNPTAISWSSEG